MKIIWYDRQLQSSYLMELVEGLLEEAVEVMGVLDGATATWTDNISMFWFFLTIISVFTLHYWRLTDAKTNYCKSLYFLNLAEVLEED